ncbi:MAG: AAA family ATPase [Gammaproteobacteria bacterium]|nr:AAA family ATPase [Gammaproteobacteria bacterium]
MSQVLTTRETLRVDAANACVWRGDEPISLSPKAFSVLVCLAERAGQLVTKQDLLETVWPRGFVTDGVLKVCIREIRGALGDPCKAPRFIETLHRRGYRLIAELCSEAPPSIATATPSVSPIGRDGVLANLSGWLALASRGQRQVVFVSGEAGIGKTAVVDAFVEQTANRALLVGRGQCIEHHSEGEAYLPMLEAVSELCRQAPDEEIITLLRRFAPSWLAHIPWLHDVAGEETPQPDALAFTRERMLREMAELLEVLTARTPVLLVLEDLHWSDYSTLDLVSMLARRRGVARLLLLITYRPVEVNLGDHPLKGVKQDLRIRGYCEDLPLDYLSARDVGIYLEQRFPDNAFPKALAAFIHRRTEGNPLFMLNVVDYLLARGSIAVDQGHWVLPSAIEALHTGVPESLREMIERQIERHSAEEQHILEAASVAGTVFTAITVASALDTDAWGIENTLTQLARRGQLVRDRGVKEWPDNTVSTSYAFAHALYENVLYERQSSARRMQSHRLIAACLERAYGARVTEIAAELALHFQQARAYAKAVTYLRQAAASAMASYAYREAMDYLARALTLPSDDSQRYELINLKGECLRDLGLTRESVAAFKAALELAVHAADKTRAWLGVAASQQIADRHYEALEALRHAEGAMAGQDHSESRARIYYLRGNTYFTLGDIEGCLKQHEQALVSAQEAGSARCEAQALSGLADAYYLRGRMRTAYEHFDRCIELSRRHGFGHIEVANLSMRGLTHSYQNDFHTALEDSLAAVEMAIRVGDLRAEILARDNAAHSLLEMADWPAVKEHGEQGLALARRLGTRCFEASAIGNVGVATAALGDRAKGEQLLREAYAISRESGLAFAGPWMLGALALAATDAETRRWALSEGEKLLGVGCVSHNHFYFFRDAMEVGLQDEQWGEVERYAHALEDYTRAEPLPWSDFLIARGRALAAYGRVDRGDGTFPELQRLRSQADREGLKASLTAITKALIGQGVQVESGSRP